MGKYKENARYDVITIRVTEDEKRKIQNLAISNNININNLIRQVLFASDLTSYKALNEST